MEGKVTPQNIEMFVSKVDANGSLKSQYKRCYEYLVTFREYTITISPHQAEKAIKTFCSNISYLVLPTEWSPIIITFSDREALSAPLFELVVR